MSFINVANVKNISKETTRIVSISNIYSRYYEIRNKIN